MLLMLSTAGLVSCGSQEIAQPSAPPKPPTPEERFETVMVRLERALTEFRPSGQEGLHAKSKMSYEILPPAAPKDAYRGKVVISSKAMYQHAEVSVIGDGASEGDPLVGTDDPAAGDSGPELDPLPMSQTEESEYFLVFEDGVWKLESKPEARYVEIWFEYALAGEAAQSKAG